MVTKDEEAARGKESGEELSLKLGMGDDVKVHRRSCGKDSVVMLRLRVKDISFSLY